MHIRYNCIICSKLCVINKQVDKNMPGKRERERVIVVPLGHRKEAKLPISFNVLTCRDYFLCMCGEGYTNTYNSCYFSFYILVCLSV